MADLKSKDDYRTMLIFKKKTTLLENANKEIEKIKVL